VSQAAKKNGSATSPRLTILRAGFRILCAVAPPIAVRAAATLFRTPPRHKTSPVERQLLESGRSEAIPMGSGKLATWSWGEGPAVLLVHGWGSRGARLGSFVEPLVAAGYTAVAFDAPGHGSSSGRLSSLPQFIEAVLAVSRAHGPFAAVIAHSMGGAATALAVGRGLDLERAAFLAPASNPGNYSRRFAEVLGIPARIRERMEKRFERQFGFRWEEFDVPSRVASFSAPLLVIHDREDREVSWNDGAVIARAWPGAQFVTTQGLGHTRIVHDPEVVERVLAFLAGAHQKVALGERTS
jgi:pimeloyl-ACP methyl ester carboxylesterase